MALTLCGRLFHNCAPLKQKLCFKKLVRGLGRANLFSLSLRGRLHEAGWLSLLGSRHVRGHTLKINFAITWKNLSPASWDPGIAMPGSRLAGLKIYHVIAIAGPARLAGTTLSCH